MVGQNGLTNQRADLIGTSRVMARLHRAKSQRIASTAGYFQRTEVHPRPSLGVVHFVNFWRRHSPQPYNISCHINIISSFDSSDFFLSHVDITSNVLNHTQLVFYAYCGINDEDAVAIDNIRS